MRQLASLQIVADLQPIPGADAIEKAQIKEWWVVVRKGEYTVGQVVVFFEIDSFLPDIEVFAFLKKGSTLKRMTVDNEVRNGIRLKTIKLRGQISQGLILPVASFPELKDTVSMDGDVTGLLNVIKYEPPIPAQLAGKVKGFFPGFIPKTDEERIQNMAGVLTGFYVTEKLDGSSVTFFKKEGVFGVCSRNLELLESEGNTQWRLAREMDLESKIPDNMALQGELVGEGIQQNPLKIQGHKVYFYNAYNIKTGRYLDFENFKMLIEALGLTTVPILDENFALPKTVEELLAYADGKSVINAESPREGVVVRPKMEMTYGGSRLSFKAISNKYLLENEE